MLRDAQPLVQTINEFLQAFHFGPRVVGIPLGICQLPCQCRLIARLSLTKPFGFCAAFQQFGALIIAILRSQAKPLAIDEVNDEPDSTDDHPNKHPELIILIPKIGREDGRQHRHCSDPGENGGETAGVKSNRFRR